ncbi:DUF4190 domain-containing protein [Halobacillus sp. A1]|uniref:DUF4190 domain-containing protein n=1 Tax=Halobacillus sp. A1 TaxID=2880262 RepID=UPI0020A6286B|nr:DUF4190 domain-containing protein [Halobacillus sp. A1]MCP3032343.1 DUF4190 domain-containing protein [Halobacillus sp. A1]
MSQLEASASSTTNGKAVASLVLGILSIVTMILMVVGLIMGAVGLVLGIIGLKEIKRQDQEGKKMAVAGIICSSLGIVLPILLSVIAFVAFMVV